MADELPDNWSARDAATRGPSSQMEVTVTGRMSEEDSRLIRERQAGRSKVMGIILVSLCILFFAITIVKIGVWG